MNDSEEQTASKPSCECAMVTLHADYKTTKEDPTMEDGPSVSSRQALRGG